LEVIMKAERKSWWPEEPQVAGKQTLRWWRRAREVKVTGWGRQVL
jgi:hypothetical protein